jgi:membrane protein implicated in regulation of membrane protease activity
MWSTLGGRPGLILWIISVIVLIAAVVLGLLTQNWPVAGVVIALDVIVSTLVRMAIRARSSTPE